MDAGTCACMKQWAGACHACACHADMLVNAIALLCPLLLPQATAALVASSRVR